MARPPWWWRGRASPRRGPGPYVAPFVRQTVVDAFGRAGVADARDLDAVEVHDCFTTTEYLAIDHLGLTAPGESWRAIEDGTIGPGGAVPVNPWMLGGYFLYGLADKDLVRAANNNLLMRSDELWVFGPTSDGVDVEVAWAEANGVPVRWFDLDHYGEAITEREDRPT